MDTNISSGLEYKAKKSFDYIVRYCNHIGIYESIAEVNDFLDEAASDIEQSPASAVFPENFKNQVAYAIRKTVTRGFVSSEFVINADFLARRFEHYFMLCSGLLDSRGEWVDAEARLKAETILGMPVESPLDDVGLLYKLARKNHSSSLSKCLCELDDRLYAETVTMPDGKTVISDIGDRISWNRKRVAQGYWNELSSEGMFFSLLTSLVFYCVCAIT